MFQPAEPQSLDETGISPVVIETLICKYLLQIGSTSGRDIAQRLCLPFGILEKTLLACAPGKCWSIKARRSTIIADALTEQGVSRARAAMQACAYVGPVPVPLDDYVMSVEVQN